jgi:SAM-dependent methyltransferase
MTSTGADRALGELFDDVAEDYDRVRQGYSPQIVEAAAVRGRLAAGAAVLEVGCGTGKLTEVLAALGYRVDAVDPGARMIQQARKRVGAAAEVTFHVGRFEEVPLPGEAFDAVFAGTSFHWLDPSVSWHKAAMHLRPGGLLALLTHMSVFNERSAEAHEGFRALLRKYAPTVGSWPSPLALDVLLAGAKERSTNASEVWDWILGDGRHRLADAEAARLFEAVETTAIVAEVELTADELIEHFRTTSVYFQIDPARRQAFEDEDRRRIEADGGTVHFSSATVLMSAVRSGAGRSDTA